MADQFLSNVERSFEDLSDHPDIGAPLSPRRAELAGLRKWRVKESESFLISCLPHRSGVSIGRVLHASRDWWQLLGIEAP